VWPPHAQGEGEGGKVSFRQLTAQRQPARPFVQPVCARPASDQTPLDPPACPDTR